MKILFLVVVFLTNVLAAQEEEGYLGSSYNISMAFEPSCLHLLGNTDLQNKHVGALVKAEFCDIYTGDSQKYLEQSFYVGTGLTFYSNSIYRDSFFLALALNIEHSWVRDIVEDISGRRYSLVGVMGTGYQFHFKKGYILSLVGYFSYQKPFSQSHTSDGDLAEELSKANSGFLPTFAIGWRF